MGPHCEPPCRAWVRHNSRDLPPFPLHLSCLPVRAESIVSSDKHYTSLSPLLVRCLKESVYTDAEEAMSPTHSPARRPPDGLLTFEQLTVHARHSIADILGQMWVMARVGVILSKRCLVLWARVRGCLCAYYTCKLK